MEPVHSFTLDDVINAYKCGLFPMADKAESKEFYWYDPPMRGQLAIERLHISQKLRRTVLKNPFEVRINTAFADVINLCAEATTDRPDTWINDGIKALFVALHEDGYGHCVECWHDGQLVGGLYGLAIGGAFMGESMFSRETDASKVALVHLCARLWHNGFTILDTQFINPHLLQFGAYEIPREKYLAQLYNALKIKADFTKNTLGEQELVKAYLAMQKTLSDT